MITRKGECVCAMVAERDTFTLTWLIASPLSLTNPIASQFDLIISPLDLVTNPLSLTTKSSQLVVYVR